MIPEEKPSSGYWIHVKVGQVEVSVRGEAEWDTFALYKKVMAFMKEPKGATGMIAATRIA